MMYPVHMSRTEGGSSRKPHSTLRRPARPDIPRDSGIAPSTAIPTASPWRPLREGLDLPILALLGVLPEFDELSSAVTGRNTPGPTRVLAADVGHASTASVATPRSGASI